MHNYNKQLLHTRIQIDVLSDVVDSVGVIELCHHSATIGQSDLNICCRLVGIDRD